MPDINTINAALRAALEPALSKREEIVIRALLGECGEGKPVAGEWDIAVDGVAIRCSGETGCCVANTYPGPGGWDWNVYDNNCERVIMHGFGCTTPEAARDAADAWTREHAAELDWRLPNPVARELTDAEVEECARAGQVAMGDFLPVLMNGDRNAARAIVDGRECESVYHGTFKAAVLSKAAEIRARGSEQPAPRSAAPDLTARMAEALREASLLHDGPVGDLWRALLAEYDAQPKEQP